MSEPPLPICTLPENGPTISPLKLNIKMTTMKNNQLNQIEIAHLACLNWQKDGRPTGRDLDYWLEAESQLKATWHMLAGECKPQTKRKSEPKKIQAGSNGTLKAPVRPELVQQF